AGSKYIMVRALDDVTASSITSWLLAEGTFNGPTSDEKMATEQYNLLIVILQVVALFFLIVYVRKTAQMAEATSKSVEMTQEMASTARLSAEATIRSAKAAEDSVQA